MEEKAVSGLIPYLLKVGRLIDIFVLYILKLKNFFTMKSTTKAATAKKTEAKVVTKKIDPPETESKDEVTVVPGGLISDPLIMDKLPDDTVPGGLNHGPTLSTDKQGVVDPATGKGIKTENEPVEKESK